MLAESQKGQFGHPVKSSTIRKLGTNVQRSSERCTSWVPALTRKHGDSRMMTSQEMEPKSFATPTKGTQMVNGKRVAVVMPAYNASPDAGTHRPRTSRISSTSRFWSMISAG